MEMVTAGRVEVRFLMFAFLYHFDFLKPCRVLAVFKNGVKIKAEEGIAQNYLRNKNLGQYSDKGEEGALVFHQLCYGILFRLFIPCFTSSSTDVS